jgi:ribosome-binding factor A
MGDRLTRLNEVIQREISALLHGRFQSETVLVTITRVEISADLCHGWVYFSVPDEAQVEKTLGLLRGLCAEIRRFLAGRIPLRRFPELHFRFDRGQGRVLRVHEILDTLTTAEPWR